MLIKIRNSQNVKPRMWGPPANVHSHPLGRGLIGCWLFNTTGNNICDATGNQNHFAGQFAGDPAWVGGGYYLDTDDALAQTGSGVSSDNIFDLYSQQTITVLVLAERIDTIGSHDYLLMHNWDAYSDSDYGFVFSDANEIGVISGSTYSAAGEGESLNANELYSIVGTFEHNTVDGAKLYVNSNFSHSKDCTDTSTSDRRLVLNARSSTSGTSFDYYAGCRFHLVAIWDRILSQAEIAWHYREPYAMFEPVSRPKYFYIASSIGTGAVIKLPHYHNPKVKPPMWGPPAYVAYAVRHRCENKLGVSAPGFAFPFVSGAGSPLELMRNQFGDIYGSPNWTAIKSGNAVDIDGTDYYSFSHDSQYNLTEEITLIWIGILDTGSNYRHFAGKHAGSGTTNCPFDFRTDNSATPKAVLARANNLDFRILTGPEISLNETHILSVSQGASPNDSTTVFFLDGAKTIGTPSGSATSSVTGNTEPILIGRRADGAVQMDGKTAFIAGFPTQFSDEQHSLFYDQPYAMFEPVARPKYFFISGGATTDLLDGKLIIKDSASNLLDGKAIVKDLATDLLDGLVAIQNATTIIGPDGKVTIKDTTTDAGPDGKIVIKDITTNLFDGKIIVEVPDFDTGLVDGKIIISIGTFATGTVTVQFTGKTSSIAFTEKASSMTFTGKKSKITFQ